MKGLIALGIIFALIGLAAIVQPMFTTSDTKDVAKLGDLKLQTKEETTHVIPPIVGEGVFVLGLVLIGAGAFVRR